jgi:hypothetical protein
METKLLLAKFSLLFIIVSFLLVLSILLIDIGVQAEWSGIQYLIAGIPAKQTLCWFGVILIFPVIIVSGLVVFFYAILLGKILPGQIAELIEKNCVIKKIASAIW